ncbi:hypothetical protein K461DRAFT_275501 [Myriangium duriaei CBS 260.36]|uniref:glucan endo-1,3-beta-D-glucosidase n=1 Tax=Myriangium duriaei CBS 260.36 TaxID=1168546 RepID=A0A9P4J7X3_9PEZI|nr:hypothetical protein K461DRAFT_275501 [Myriangium duriaei CBS 260.36]
MAPFNEELSIHIRGPFNLKQFAYYTPSTSTSKRTSEEIPRPRDPRGPLRRDMLERSLASVVCPKANQTSYTVAGKTFKIECGMDRQGNIGSSLQPNFGSCIQKCAQTSGCKQVSYVKAQGGMCYLKGTSVTLRPQDYVRGIAGARLTASSSGATTSAKQTSSTTSSSTSSSSVYTRQSYYNAAAQIANGVTFLNNLGGGTYPGIWSAKFGNSLGYASADGLKPAMSSTTLADTTLPSLSELSLWASDLCTTSSPCPYSRPGTVAHHGFGGASKLFLFEFLMPHSDGADMPALWFLNARIPRTQQYGSCSCWGNTGGCGELDAFEVLTKSEDRMIASVHGVQAATNPNYFARPTTKTVKAAVSMVGGTTVLKVLDDSYDFSTGLSQRQVDALLSTAAVSAQMKLPS